MHVAPYTPIYTVEQDGDRWTIGIQHRAIGGPFEDSEWYTTERRVLSPTYATQAEAEAECAEWRWSGPVREWLVPTDTRDYGIPELYIVGISRAAYEAGCRRPGLTPYDEAEIQARRVLPGMTVSPWNGILPGSPIRKMVAWYWLKRRYAGITEEEAKIARGPLLTCPVCGQTGHAGAYPFSTGYGNGRCDDCG